MSLEENLESANSPHNDTLDTIITACFAETDDDREAHDVAQQRSTPPQTITDPFALGAGRMAVTREGTPIQVPQAVRAGLVTLHQLHEMILGARRICSKYDAPCLYVAVPRKRGCSKKSNVAYVQMVAFVGQTRSKERHRCEPPRIV